MVTKPPNLDPKLSQGAATLIRALLVKNPRARLGGRDGLNELKQVAYLNVPIAPVTWDDLYSKQIDMPYKPRLADDADISSFETTFTKEKPIDSVIDPNQENQGTEDGKKKKKTTNKKKKGLFSSLFGSSNNNNNTTGNGTGKGTGNGDANNAQQHDDAFKDFSFAKADDVIANSTATATEDK
jgi:hypothetical protein